MGQRMLIDHIGLGGLFFVTLGLVVLSLEIGYRAGGWRAAKAPGEKETPVGAMVGATLGLLAFILAFTFGMAADRHDARRRAFLEEVNAVGTAYLRAEMLPEPHRTEVRHALREYVDARLEVVRTGDLAKALRRSEELHGRLWSRAVAVGESDPRSITAGLFIQALNEVIDLHTTRVTAAVHSRIPDIVWLALYAITISSMTGMGYQAGLAGTRRSVAALGLAFTFSAVIYLSADLDSGRQGMIRVSQQAMVDLRNSMGQAP